MERLAPPPAYDMHAHAWLTRHAQFIALCYLVLQCQLSEQLVASDSAFDAHDLPPIWPSATAALPLTQIFHSTTSHYQMHSTPSTSPIRRYAPLSLVSPNLPISSPQSPDHEGTPTPVFTLEQQAWIENLITMRTNSSTPSVVSSVPTSTPMTALSPQCQATRVSLSCFP